MGGWKGWCGGCSDLCGCAESPSMDKITLPVQEHPPVSFGGAWGQRFKVLWRVEVTWEGGKVGVVPEGACGSLQNRPPGAESPSRYRNTLRGRNHPPGWAGGGENGCMCGSWEGGTVVGGRKSW